ncbi:MAG: type III polyketide synthase [Hyphomicrobiales bacterium]|nr:type III polyketide synthase [Hyphomicrobiales bacterium]
MNAPQSFLSPRLRRAPGTGVKAKLTALATAVPKHRISQADAREKARMIFAERTPLFAALEPVFENAEIAARYSCQPIEWFAKPSDFREKARLYEQHAVALSVDAATKALDGAGLEAGEIDALVCVSSTGVMTPGLDAHLINRLPFRPDTVRLPIFGLGCAGGVLGLTRAVQLVQSRPRMKCLLVVVELCTLAFRHDRLTKSNLVATALFGDGAAAAIITSGPARGVLGILGAAGEHCWPGTLDVMGWRVDGQGLDVIFNRRIPEIVATKFTSALNGFLGRARLCLEDIARPCCHPGGAKVVAALEQAFGLCRGGLDFERQVLAEFGNMSAPTVLFVLDRIVKAGRSGPTLLCALGPGFTAAFQTITLIPDGRAVSQAA